VTNPQKTKGDKAELEIARILHGELGLPVRRKLGAGRSDDAGDLDGLPGVAAQVKNYRNVTVALNDAMNDLPTQVVNAGADFGAAFIRRPGGRWVVAMSVPDWCAMYREALA
jgi:hypothetical protein